MFFATYLLNIYIHIRVIMNRQGHHNIRNGIVWAQTGHSTGTCTATLCVMCVCVVCCACVLRRLCVCVESECGVCAESVCGMCVLCFGVVVCCAVSLCVVLVLVLVRNVWCVCVVCVECVRCGVCCLCVARPGTRKTPRV